MADFRRAMLKGYGLDDEAIDAIMAAHVGVTDSMRDTIEKLKAENDRLTAENAKLPEVQRQLETAQSEAQKAAAYKQKHKEVEQEFADYKAAQERAATKKAKETAYRDMLISAGISEKYVDTIIKASAEEIDAATLDENGKLANVTDLSKTAKETWKDFVVTESVKGAETVNPPKSEEVRGSSGRAKEIAERYHNTMYGSRRNDAKGEN